MGHLIAACLRAQHPIHAGPADPQLAGDFRGPDACLLERMISSALRRAVGTRPLSQPCAFALAIPSLCHSAFSLAPSHLF